MTCSIYYSSAKLKALYTSINLYNENTIATAMMIANVH